MFPAKGIVLSVPTTRAQVKVFFVEQQRYPGPALFVDPVKAVFKNSEKAAWHCSRGLRWPGDRVNQQLVVSIGDATLYNKLNFKDMALDIYMLANGGPAKLRYQIQHTQYMRMEYAINLFKKRSGVYIGEYGEYGDTTFSSGLSPLIQTLKECGLTIKMHWCARDGFVHWSARRGGEKQARDYFSWCLAV